MTFFATAGHLSSWIGVCPGMNESTGINKSGHTRHGNANLKRVLGTAAMAAIEKKDSYYAVYYRRVAARRDAQRALVAVMHKIVIAIWHVLHNRVAYQDLGADYLTKRAATRDKPHDQTSQQPRRHSPIRPDRSVTSPRPYSPSTT